jgi:hypothetical protein
MNELEKFEKLKKMGYTYDRHTGLVTSPHGKEIKAIKLGWVYFVTKIGEIKYQTYAHRYGFWFITGLLPSQIDHINRVRHDNRFENIRAADYILNGENKRWKGYIKTIDAHNNDRFMIITIRNGKFQVLGKFDTEEQVIEFRKYLKENKNNLIQNG